MNPDTRIAYTQEDGTVAIVTPTPEFIAKGGDINALMAKSVPEGALRSIVREDEIPVDRYFRNAWKLGQGIEIDRTKAEVIHMDNLRKIRDDKLKAEDIEYQKALEFRDDAKMNAVANRKKKLRDMPVDTDFSGMTLDELKNFKPEILK
jgi:hypothetical protein